MAVVERTYQKVWATSDPLQGPLGDATCVAWNDLGREPRRSFKRIWWSLALWVAPPRMVTDWFVSIEMGAERYPCSL